MISWLKSKFQLNPTPPAKPEMVKDYVYVGCGVMEEVEIPKVDYDKQHKANVEMVARMNRTPNTNRPKPAYSSAPVSQPQSRRSDDDMIIPAYVAMSTFDTSSSSSSSYDSGSSCDSGSSSSCD